MTPARLHADADAGLWSDTAPEPPATPPIRGAHDSDIAVIGAGYTGLSAALHAAAAGANVTVLEAAAPGHGGSGRNVGLVNAGLWLMPDALEARLGPDRGGRLLAALGDGPALVWDIIARHRIDCEATANGTLHCAPDAAGLRALRARTAQWHRRGAPVVMLDAGETAARIGATAFRGALLDRSAGTVQPLGYARGLARAAIAAGAKVHGHSPVLSLRRDRDRWELATPQGSLRAARVIVATNTYSAGPCADLRRAQSVLPYFNIATKPLPAPQRATILPGAEGCWDTHKVLTSFRLDAAGRLILGSVGALGPLDRAAHEAWARRRLAGLFPALADLAFEHAWYGRIGTTPDALPRFNRHGTGMWSISGYNGRGIAPGTVFGRMLAQLALDRIAPDAIPLPLIDAPPRPDPLRHLREPVWRAGSAALHLAGARRG